MTELKEMDISSIVQFDEIINPFRRTLITFREMFDIFNNYF